MVTVVLDGDVPPGGEPLFAWSGGENGGSDPESGGESGSWCPVVPTTVPLLFITIPFGICVPG